MKSKIFILLFSLLIVSVNSVVLDRQQLKTWYPTTYNTTQIIDINGRVITSISVDTFPGLVNLYELYLHRNQLSSLEVGASN